VAFFFLFAVLVVFGLHYYVWRKTVRATTRPRTLGRRIGTGIVVALTVLLLATFIGSRVMPHSAETVLAWPGYLWLAVMFYLVVVLLVLELPALFVRRRLSRPEAKAAPQVAEPVTAGAPAQRASATSAPNLPDATDALAKTDAALTDAPVGAVGGSAGESRRLFLARGVAITAGLVAVGVTGSGVSAALGPPRIKRVQVPLAKLPRAADGTRIAVVSDIHLGPLRGLSHTRRIVDMINSLDADVVAIVGDLVDGSVADLGHAATPLRDINADAYFVTGNHEYFSGYEQWVAEVAELGVRPLRNEKVALPQGLDLAGVNDATGESYHDGPDYDAALRDRDPAKAVVLMAHQPVQAHEAAKRGVDLQLSGHTHGGQLWPFHYIVRATGQPVVSGMGDVDGMPVYVTNGAGFWGPPVRVGASPDITLVQLRSTQ
jgi:uncharacterized protein